ncbi:hypothetical protein [Burkholderia pseudomallei]|uniref:hypothetical protein n=1 Tax=Burkholderia pseudomallei TaxID=28450 RepID=UPI000536E73B|nr:hypothetical protein [Burkholderia pseudomallei]KGW87648.1 hypothetical protein Y048_3280 [Burkholderia pseudomallei MSHR456]
MTIHITQGPPLTNPEALSSVAELRCELHRANKTVQRLLTKIAQYDEVGSQMVGSVNHILTLHVQGNITGLVEWLDKYLSERPRVRERIEEAIESKNLQRMH